MATRVTDGSGCRPRFARLTASPLPCACIPPTKSEEKVRLLAVYPVSTRVRQESQHEVLAQQKDDDDGSENFGKKKNEFAIFQT